MILTDFSLYQRDDSTVVISMVPPTSIGGMSLQWTMQKHFGQGSSGLIQRYIDPTIINGASGITIANSGQGIFNVQINSVDTSGLTPGNYVHTAKRTDSGHVTSLAEGFALLKN